MTEIIIYIAGLIVGIVLLRNIRSRTDTTSYEENFGELFCIFWPFVLPILAWRKLAASTLK